MDERIKNIVLIEDDPGDRKLIMLAFKKTGINTNFILIHDGEEAIDFMLKQNNYSNFDSKISLIILDLNLPKIEGHHVLKTIKNNSVYKSVPVIILTTSNAESDIDKSFGYNADEYFVKPVEIEELDHIIKEISYKWLVNYK